MTQDGRPIRGRSGKMHPLFIDLYLSSDSDDSGDSAEERQAERQARRRSILQKRVTRRA